MSTRTISSFACFEFRQRTVNVTFFTSGRAVSTRTAVVYGASGVSSVVSDWNPGGWLSSCAKSIRRHTSASFERA